jgi:hypothetical protein
MKRTPEQIEKEWQKVEDEWGVRSKTTLITKKSR